MAKTKVSRLAQIYRSERSQGRGLSSAIGKATLEKIDPRQFFNQQGLLASIFPSLFKAYKAPSQSDKTTAPTALNFSTASLESKIENLSMHAKISARNSLVLPSMARDMNLTRQNIAKLVKLQGGKPSYKSDMFFMRAAEREAAYESQFRRTATSSLFPSTTPTPSKEPSGSGILSSLFKVVSTIGATIASAITPLISVIKSILGPLLSLAKTGISLVLSAGGKAIGAVAGGLASILRSAIPFLLNPAVLATLGVGGIAALIAYLIKNDAMSGKEGEETVAGANQSAQEPGTTTMGPDEQAIVPSTTSPGLGKILDEAEKAKRVGPNGERLVIQNGVRGYMKKGMGRSGGLQFVPLPASTTPTLPTPTAKPGQYGQEKRFPSMPDATVKDAISVAAKKTGVPEALLLAIARQESGFDPNAKAKSSSATGLYQFIDDTWRRYLLKYSKDYPELTSGRTDPYANALAGALYAKESISYLKEKNISPTAENIYAVHFLGPEGSRKLLTASDDTTVNNVISAEQLKANPAVFGNEQKGYKTVAQVKDFFFNKIGKLTAEYETALNAGSSSVQMAAASITPVAATPTIPSNIQTTIKSDGTKLGTATIEVAQSRVQIGSAPIVVAPPTVNVQAPQIQGGAGGFGAMASSSVVDTEFMKLLVGRTVTL